MVKIWWNIFSEVFKVPSSNHIQDLDKIRKFHFLKIIIMFIDKFAPKSPSSESGDTTTGNIYKCSTWRNMTTDDDSCDNYLPGTITSNTNKTTMIRDFFDMGHETSQSDV